MSNLCHNCGECHLDEWTPQPCLFELRFCPICSNHGHQFNFCPLSVLNIDKNYQYWMLCHNCDTWHLPKPCELPLEKCAQCGLLGHLPFFCPTNPLPRKVPPSLGDNGNVKTGSKRQRSGSPMAVPRVPYQTEIYRQIKFATAIEVINLLSRYSKEEVLEQMSPIPALPSSMLVAQASMSNESVLATGANEHGHNNVRSRSEEAAKGAHGIMHDRFEGGELARGLSEMLPNKSDNKSSGIGQQPTLNPNRRISYRCNQCKQSHKKCTHVIQSEDCSRMPASIEKQQLPDIVGANADQSGNSSIGGDPTFPMCQFQMGSGTKYDDTVFATLSETADSPIPILNATDYSAEHGSLKLHDWLQAGTDRKNIATGQNEVLPEDDTSSQPMNRANNAGKAQALQPGRCDLYHPTPIGIGNSTPENIITEQTCTAIDSTLAQLHHDSFDHGEVLPSGENRTIKQAEAPNQIPQEVENDGPAVASPSADTNKSVGKAAPKKRATRKRKY